MSQAQGVAHAAHVVWQLWACKVGGLCGAARTVGSEMAILGAGGWMVNVAKAAARTVKMGSVAETRLQEMP